MRGLGIGALIFVVLSFLFWLISWLYWNLLLDMLGLDSSFRYIAITSSILSMLCEYLAVGLLSVGLIIASKRLPQ